jgi:hypothetical protein
MDLDHVAMGMVANGASGIDPDMVQGEAAPGFRTGDQVTQ